MFTSLYGASKDFNFGGDNSSPFSGGESLLKTIERKYEELDVIASIPIAKMEDNINKGYDIWYVLVELWNTFIIADIMTNIFAILLVLLFTILSFALKKKKLISNIFLLLALASYPLTKSIVSKKINNFARASKIENLEVKQFRYSTNVFVRGDIVNYGKYEFKLCVINIKMYKKTDRPPINLVNKIRPLAQERIEIRDLKINEFRSFTVTIFSIPKDISFETKIIASCK